jgi:hypothetical protein
VFFDSKYVSDCLFIDRIFEEKLFLYMTFKYVAGTRGGAVG